MSTAIFPGSFDPFTIGHADIVRRGLQLFDRIVIAVGYNAQKAPVPPAAAAPAASAPTAAAAPTTAAPVPSAAAPVPFAEACLSEIPSAPPSAPPAIAARTAAIERIYADEPRVKVVSYSCLTVDLAAQEGARFLLRGVRSVKDFEYERDLAAVNAAISLPPAAPAAAAPAAAALAAAAPAAPAAPVVSGNWLPESRPLETILLIAAPRYAHISSSLVRELQAYGRDVTPYLP